MVKRNVIANYLGGGWSALMGLAFLPLYIRYLGTEAYGLIGVFTSIQVWFALLDVGLSGALSREFARFKAGAHTAKSILELFYSLEVIYLCAALALSAGVVISAPWVSVNWLQAESLSTATVQQALVLIGCVAALRWIGALYRGALIGMQQQVWLSACGALFATLRGAGVVPVLVFVSATIQAFFVYQAGVAAIEIVVLALGSRRHLPSSHDYARFSWVAVKSIWPFAAGMATIALLSILLTQIDKILLSKLLPLTEFGYYMLAFTAASGLTLMTTPVGNAAYPRLTELATRGDTAALATAYHYLCQLLTLVLGPIALVLAVFAEQALLLWTHDEALTAAVAPLLALLMIGNLLNGLMHVPYHLQLAHGWTRFTVRVNTVALIILTPLIYFGVSYFGAAAAAVVWIVLNASYVTIAVPLMHRKLLPGEKWSWYRQDVVGPLLVTLGAVSVVRVLAPAADVNAPMEMVRTLSFAFFAAFVCTALAIPRARWKMLAWIRKAQMTLGMR